MGLLASRWIWTSFIKEGLEDKPGKKETVGVWMRKRSEMRQLKETTEKTKHFPLYIFEKSFLSTLATSRYSIELLNLRGAPSDNCEVGLKGSGQEVTGNQGQKCYSVFFSKPEGSQMDEVFAYDSVTTLDREKKMQTAASENSNYTEHRGTKKVS